MKPLKLITLFIFCVVFSSFGQELSDHELLYKLINERLNDPNERLDNIEGIWSINQKDQVLFKGKPDQLIDLGNFNVIILKDVEFYKEWDFPAKQKKMIKGEYLLIDINSEEISVIFSITPTMQPNRYIIYHHSGVSFKLYLTSKYTFEAIMEAPNDYVSEAISTRQDKKYYRIIKTITGDRIK